MDFITELKDFDLNTLSKKELTELISELKTKSEKAESMLKNTISLENPLKLKVITYGRNIFKEDKKWSKLEATFSKYKSQLRLGTSLIYYGMMYKVKDNSNFLYKFFCHPQSSDENLKLIAQVCLGKAKLTKDYKNSTTMHELGRRLFLHYSIEYEEGWEKFFTALGLLLDNQESFEPITKFKYENYSIDFTDVDRYVLKIGD